MCAVRTWLSSILCRSRRILQKSIHFFNSFRISDLLAASRPCEHQSRFIAFWNTFRRIGITVSLLYSPTFTPRRKLGVKVTSIIELKPFKNSHQPFAFVATVLTPTLLRKDSCIEVESALRLLQNHIGKMARGCMATFVKETLPTIGRSLVYIALCVVLFFIGLVKGMSTLTSHLQLKDFCRGCRTKWRRIRWYCTKKFSLLGPVV